MHANVKPILLVAEDDEDLNLLIRRALAKVAPDWEIRHSLDGRTALELLREEPRPGLLITDLQMPVMDGFELIRSVRGEKELSEVYIMVFSSREDPTDQRRCAELGANEFVSKSHTVVGLRERFISWMRARNQGT
jgi:CheY-like chemotaxis protein